MPPLFENEKYASGTDPRLYPLAKAAMKAADTCAAGLGLSFAQRDMLGQVAYDAVMAEAGAKARSTANAL